MTRGRSDRGEPDALGAWPHERRCAQSLEASGRRVEFVRAIRGNGVKTADLVMDGVVWELKSPESPSLRSLQRVLRRAGRQSPNDIVDTSRATRLSDASIERELRRLLPLTRSVRRLLVVRKTGEVVDMTC